MGRYSNDIKTTMVTKLCTPGGPTTHQLSKETGISAKSLYNWVEEFGRSKQVGKDRRPVDWSPEERLQAVFEILKLSEEDLGEYLRKHGLHTSHLEEWKQEMVGLVGDSVVVFSLAVADVKQPNYIGDYHNQFLGIHIAI